VHWRVCALDALVTAFCIVSFARNAGQFDFVLLENLGFEVADTAVPPEYVWLVARATVLAEGALAYAALADGCQGFDFTRAKSDWRVPQGAVVRLQGVFYLPEQHLLASVYLLELLEAVEKEPTSPTPYFIFLLREWIALYSCSLIFR
jgi:hypothetical protein